MIDLIWNQTEPMSDDDLQVWFTPPWRSVHGAAFLTVTVGNLRQASSPASTIITRVSNFPDLRPETSAIDLVPDNVSLYEHLQSLRLDLLHERNSHNLWATVGLECLIKDVANSTGGGHTHNIYLLEAARQALYFGWASEDDLAEAVLRARMRDALGTRPSPILAESFSVAWRSGRCDLAYMLAGRRQR